MDAGHIHAALVDAGIAKILSVRMGLEGDRSTWAITLDATATASERISATAALATVQPITDRERVRRARLSDPLMGALILKGALTHAELDAQAAR